MGVKFVPKSLPTKFRPGQWIFNVEILDYSETCFNTSIRASINLIKITEITELHIWTDHRSLDAKSIFETYEEAECYVKKFFEENKLSLLIKYGVKV